MGFERRVDLSHVLHRLGVGSALQAGDIQSMVSQVEEKMATMHPALVASLDIKMTALGASSVEDFLVNKLPAFSLKAQAENISAASLVCPPFVGISCGFFKLSCVVSCCCHVVSCFRHVVSCGVVLSHVGSDRLVLSCVASCFLMHVSHVVYCCLVLTHVVVCLCMLKAHCSFSWALVLLFCLRSPECRSVTHLVSRTCTREGSNGLPMCCSICCPPNIP